MNAIYILSKNLLEFSCTRNVFAPAANCSRQKVYNGRNDNKRVSSSIYVLSWGIQDFAALHLSSQLYLSIQMSKGFDPYDQWWRRVETVGKHECTPMSFVLAAEDT